MVQGGQGLKCKGNWSGDVDICCAVEPGWPVLCLSHVELFIWRQPLQPVSASFSLSCKTLSWFVFDQWGDASACKNSSIKPCLTSVTSRYRRLDLIVTFGLPLYDIASGFDRNVMVNVFSLQPLEYSSYRGSRTSSRASSARTSPVVSPPPQTPSHQKHGIFSWLNCFRYKCWRGFLNLVSIWPEFLWKRVWPRLNRVALLCCSASPPGGHCRTTAALWPVFWGVRPAVAASRGIWTMLLFLTFLTWVALHLQEAGAVMWGLPSCSVCLCFAVFPVVPSFLCTPEPISDVVKLSVDCERFSCATLLVLSVYFYSLMCRTNFGDVTFVTLILDVFYCLLLTCSQTKSRLESFS